MGFANATAFLMFETPLWKTPDRNPDSGPPLVAKVDHDFDTLIWPNPKP